METKRDDQVKVKNVTDHDVTYTFDGAPRTLKAGSYKTEPRYVADHATRGSWAKGKPMLVIEELPEDQRSLDGLSRVGAKLEVLEKENKELKEENEYLKRHIKELGGKSTHKEEKTESEPEPVHKKPGRPKGK